VTTLRGPVDLGRNWLEWDVRDRRGDELANGVYLFKLSLEDASGRSRAQVDRIVVHR
jgi:hypothetical protein